MTIRVKQIGNGEIEIQFVPSAPKRPQIELQPQFPPARRKLVDNRTEIHPGVFI
jgi:hypothetical protein